MPREDHRDPSARPLPAYTVRESDRARRVRLTVTARDGLVVVVPRRFPHSRVPTIVAARHEWVLTALERVRERREALEAGRDTLPERIELPGLGESWAVAYRPSARPGVRSQTSRGVLTLSGATDDLQAVRAALLRFCRRRAAEVLPRLLADLAREQRLHHGRVTVRRQRSRWGSCSAGGSISLNASLGFLPPRLVRYVLLHELVHTRRLDHSPAFHALLAEREPEARALARELREAWRHVPAWALDG